MYLVEFGRFDDIYREFIGLRYIPNRILCAMCFRLGIILERYITYINMGDYQIDEFDELR